MIHQLIFAAPKPGMSEKDFQDYWVDVHAVRYASKIPQIKQYVVDTRIALPGESGEPLWSGIAEMWVDDEADQLASLQSREYLEGARPDEPKWAAFWRTLVLDTESYLMRTGQPEGDNGVKLVVLAKRRGGMDLNYFRRNNLDTFAPRVLAVPGLRRYVQCHARDVMYAVGEAPLDIAHQLWFDDVESLTAALGSPEYATALQELRTIAEHRYIHPMAVAENWIIRPGTR
ncbi:EthD family reductase [Actinosynnema sp. CS-041913]|uniref:EthD domain-containing protein n=1 Tax=Actinosynnema sp. CS-041913 TaxID=3239917 RepID=UPI003D8A778D